ncbi:glycosyltransferase family 4 protein [Halorussus halobius]|uniref:glycosyltransferase family 4 protein n=1 Tax=Halorussus halobius TaxID=1710537 RepID=UPI0010932CBC|nr:glycosyltransferase family 4 protein [Halorussus halobius]
MSQSSVISPVTNVVHLTTAHGPFDTRILHKEAKSLDRVGYDVSLIVHYDADETVDGVQIQSLGTADSRIERWQSIPKAYRKAKNASGDIYHFHDPELLPVGLALKRTTDARIVYDVHENFGNIISTREWIPKPIRPVLSKTYPWIQSRIARRFDALVAATEWIAEPLKQRGHSPVVTLHNFPAIEQMTISDVSVERDHEYVLTYVGGLSEVRGVHRMLRVTKCLRDEGYDVGLWLLGPFMTDETERKVKAYIAENNLDDHVRLFGYVAYEDVLGYLSRADVGLALVDRDHYRGGIPTKLFEYMYAELPVVVTEIDATDQYFPDDCGIVVQHPTTENYADAIESLLIDDQRREALGENGPEYVRSEFSWEVEKERLLDLYDSLS